MDVSAFFDVPENERHCVHAATEEEAKIVMGWFIDQGRPNWRGVGSPGTRRSENTKWNYYKENTVSKMAWNEVFA